jgi:O-antigen biosynthesis protein
VHDRHGWSIEQHRRNIKSGWPWLEAEVYDASDGIADSHGIFATSWETAYKVLTSEARGTRFYLVQDFEPAFYPAGSEALMAEATYRFGFHGITAGAWLAALLRREYGMPADHFEFGCDLERYGRGGERQGNGICVYSRPTTARRAFELCLSALDLFSERHPDVDVHLYGEDVRIPRLPFRATQHGQLTAAELNRLYNRCVAGLVISATNVSLVPHEMLAAGCIPVVNDAAQNRMVLDNPHVAYAPATPFDLANALSLLVDRPDEEREATARTAAASVHGKSWDDAGAAVDRAVRSTVMSARQAAALAAVR